MQALTFAPSYARGIRRRYVSLPADVRSWIAEQVGEVREAVDLVGGFSPGAAAIVRGRRRTVFCKAVGSRPNAVSLELYRGERERLAALPDHPAIVKPLVAADLNVADETYAVTLFPAVPGRAPSHPWTAADADPVFRQLDELADHLARTGPCRLPPTQGLADFFGRWPSIAADAADPWHRRPFVRTSLDGLLSADARVRGELAGEWPAHTDLRADNILVGRDGGSPRVWFVDWAAAVRAARWVDPAILTCDLAVSLADRADGGSLDIWSYVRSHSATAWIDPALMWGMFVALAGALHRQSQEPAPPGLPTLRAWQGSCADTLLRFAERCVSAVHGLPHLRGR